MTDDMFDDIVHGYALATCLDQAHEQQHWPDMEATRCRAYRYYEKELKRKHKPPD
jgi:hypothetical protein